MESELMKGSHIKILVYLISFSNDIYFSQSSVEIEPKTF